MHLARDHWYYQVPKPPLDILVGDSSPVKKEGKGQIASALSPRACVGTITGPSNSLSTEENSIRTQWLLCTRLGTEFATFPLISVKARRGRAQHGRSTAGPPILRRKAGLSSAVALSKWRGARLRNQDHLQAPRQSRQDETSGEGFSVGALSVCRYTITERLANASNGSRAMYDFLV
ncbi:hypothetical protein JMJ77_0014202 [Colletotrichum scovillei]|uniref:Uncharacterized protein n=1 Tax=Colletotrichum scovillei TaxID=1209932 RepID=A0A9P7UAM8_9PEZI|nr:hypothetical protein JMJ77_0014202 [Colletotrichum scovillei]KAG7065730.1 hypothetical protein JMJ78_0012478 [Colletotrichum scovillei]KAG7068330.1 hypothetical protein JMJ76_0008021 [Colletotrichum scovillei]